MEILKKAKVKTMLSIVLTPANFDNTAGLLAIAKKLGIKKIVTSPLMGNTIKRISKSANIREYAQNAAVSAVNYYNEAKKIGINELRIKARKKSFALRIPIRESPDVGCLIESQIVVWPSGQISLCEHMEDLAIGTLSTPLAELMKNKNKIIKGLRQRLPVSNEECKGCKQKNICEGGCAFSARCITGDPMKKDLLSCAYFQKLNELLNTDNKKLKEEKDGQ
jgi:radical SAM protein with 4Fe4S-binding SPASM domain